MWNRSWRVALCPKCGAGARGRPYPRPPRNGATRHCVPRASRYNGPRFPPSPPPATDRRRAPGRLEAARQRMQFNSQEYFIFLGIALTIFWLLRNYEAPRLRLLFVSSCLFYMAWNPKYIVLLLASTFYDYFIGNAIHASDDERVRKRWVTVSIVGNLAFLGVFKYFNFASRSIGDLFGLFGVHFQAPYLDVLLPVGISF